MTSEALKNLLRRHGKEIADEADAEQDERDKKAGASASGPSGDAANSSRE